MYFKLAGITSLEDEEVAKEDGKYIYIQRDEDGRFWQFEKKSGKCINDYTAFGAKRYIDPIK